MKITDGNRTIEINMVCWYNSHGWDIARDYFVAECLPMDDDGVYIVDDVDSYCDQAMAWGWESDSNDVSFCEIF